MSFKFFRLTLFAAALATIAPAQNAPSTANVNVVANWSMEDLAEGAVAAWKQDAAVDGVEYVHTQLIAQQGTSSIGFRKATAPYFPVAQWLQDLPAPPPGATHIQWVAWVKADRVTKSVIDFQFAGHARKPTHQWAQYIGVRTPADAPITHDWKLYTGIVPLPREVGRVRLALQMYGPGSILFDSIGARYITGGN